MQFVTSICYGFALVACLAAVIEARTCRDVQVPPCRVRASRDVIFIVDASDSMDPSRFYGEMLDYVQSLWCTLSVNDMNRGAVITFGRTITAQVPLREYTQDQWFNEIEKIRTDSSACCYCCTPLAEGFRAARLMLKNSPAPDASGRPTLRIAFVITDGDPWQNTQVVNDELEQPLSAKDYFLWPDYMPAEYRYEIVPREAKRLKNLDKNNPVRLMLIGVPNKHGSAPEQRYFSGLPDPRLGKGMTQCLKRGIRTSCSIMNPDVFPIVSVPIEKNLFNAASWSVEDLITETVDDLCEILPTRAPTFAPTPRPTDYPTFSPSNSPTFSIPTKSPSGAPTMLPSFAPTFSAPSAAPSAAPTTSVPTRNPTSSVPTKAPTSSAPTWSPTASPTVTAPTSSPTRRPSRSPSAAPTYRPSRSPTTKPSRSPTFAPTKRPTPKPTFLPSNAPTYTPTASPTPKPTPAPTNFPSKVPSFSPTEFIKFSSLDLYVYVDRSKSMRWRANSCREAPGSNPNADNEHVCWELFLFFVEQLVIRSSKLIYDMQNEIGWQGDMEDKSQGLRVWLYGFACSGGQSVPVVERIGERLTTFDEFKSAMTAAKTLLPDGGTCPAAAIQRSLGQIMAHDLISRPYKAALLLTDGVFYDQPQPEIASRGLSYFGVLTYALGIAIPETGDNKGLTPSEIADQRKQLLSFVNGDPNRLINLSASGIHILESIAQSFVDRLPIDVARAYPRVLQKPYYCDGFTNNERCLNRDEITFPSYLYCRWVPNNPDKFSGNGKCVDKCGYSAEKGCNKDSFCVWEGKYCRPKVLSRSG